MKNDANADVLPPESLKSHAVSGVGWNTAAKVVTQIIQFASSVALARLIEPSAFGLVAMLALGTGLASTFADLGFGSAIVQRQKITDEQLDTAFWSSTALGTTIAFLMLAAASPVADFFHEPALADLGKLASLNFIFSAIGVVPSAILYRNLEFRRGAMIALFGVVTSNAASLAMTIWFPGALPLVVGPIVGQCVTATMYMLLCGWWPTLRFRNHSFKALAQIGLYLSAYGILNYWSRNLDNLVIGKWIGAEPLAFYARAYGLMQLPVTAINSVLATALVPIMARIQNDTPRCRRVFLRAQRTIAFVTFPSMLGLSLVAEPFVMTLYGENWLPMVPILRVLAITGMLQGVGNPVGWIYISQGRTDLMFRVGLFFTFVIVAGICVGALYGSALSVAIGYSLSLSILVYPVLAVPGRLIAMPVRDVVAAVGPAALCSIGMGTVVWLAVEALSPRAAPPIVLVVSALIGAFAYVALMVCFQPFALRDLWQLVREMRMAESK
jgi:PST family polysaccharide transporter